MRMVQPDLLRIFDLEHPADFGMPLQMAESRVVLPLFVPR